MGRMIGFRRVILGTICVALGYCAPALDPVTDVVRDGGDDGMADGDSVAWDDGRIADADAEVPPGLVCDVVEHVFAAADADACRSHPWYRDDPAWTPTTQRCVRFSFPGLASDGWPYVQLMFHRADGVRVYSANMGWLVFDGDVAWVQDIGDTFQSCSVRYCR